MGCFFDSGPDFGTRLDVGDDGSQLVNFTMGFTFPFYGIVYNSVFVNSNGNLTFNTPSSLFVPTFEDFIDGPPRIAPYKIDLDTTCLPPTNGVFVKQFPDRLIVTYLRDAYFFCPNNPQINSFQVVLFNTGLIRFAYCTLDNTLPAGDFIPSFPLVGVASGDGGPSSIFQYNPPANFNPQQTVVGPTGFLDQNNQFLDWQFNGNNYDLLLLPCLPFIVSCPANITQDNDPEQCGAIVNYPDPTVTSTCPDFVPDVTVSCTPASGSFFDVGTTTVTCTATDDAGNQSSCSFEITVEDTEPPTIMCPVDITQDNDPGECGAFVNYPDPTVSDNCPDVTVSCTPASGSFFDVGTTTVTCTATDDAGNQSSCSFEVTVEDTEPPTIMCPNNITVRSDAQQNGAIVNYPDPAVTDNCPGVMFSCTPASGSFFPIGETQVICTATDATGNTAECTFLVRVIADPCRLLS